MDYIGLDIGGTSIKAGLVDQTGQILESQKAPTIIDDLNGFLSNLTELIRNFQKSFKVAAVGIGVPGLRNSKTHVVETSPNIPCLVRVNLEDLVADQVHLPVISENDANAGAYAEFVCGAGAGTRQMVYLTLGTGLGSGLILDGKLFTGASGYAGEFGHTVIDPNGRLCGCGKGEKRWRGGARPQQDGLRIIRGNRDCLAIRAEMDAVNGGSRSYVGGADRHRKSSRKRLPSWAWRAPTSSIY